MRTPTPLTDTSTLGIHVVTREHRLKFLGHVLDQDLYVTFELRNGGFPETGFELPQQGRNGRKRVSEI